MSLPYYRWFPGDYLRDTRHLSMLQHGAYRILIDHYMATGRPLTNDLSSLYRVCLALSPEEQNAVQFVLVEFFRLDGGVWLHKRCDEELEHQGARSKSAKNSAERRWEQQRSDANVMRTHSDGNANQNQSQNQKEIKDSHSYAMGGVDAEKTAPSPEAAVVESVLLDCPAQKLVDLYHRKLPSAPQCLVLTQARRGYLKARWREYAVIKGWQTEAEGMEFFGEFFDFVARSKFLTGRANGRDGRAPFVADMEWLFRPGNFAKVIEGKYHA